MDTSIGKHMNRHFLALADGTVFYGHSEGAATDCPGEVVFNTGMTGYQEIVSDPSYAGQFVTLSTSEVGNYGCCAADMESGGLFLSGLLVREMNEPSHFRAEESLTQLLKRFHKPALSHLDTRRLVLHIREHGTQKAWLHASDTVMSETEAIQRANQWSGLDGINTVSQVSVAKPYDGTVVRNQTVDETPLPTDAPTVIALDLGIKWNIVRSLEKAGMRVTVLPYTASSEEILAYRPDGVFFSNGPGDPAGVTNVIETARTLIGRLPIMGICLGHQILAIAAGATCGRLTFGHHGCNHPVKNLLDGTIAITSQNHNFAVQMDTVPTSLELTHLNLNDGSIEGFRYRNEPVLCVQFHPEAAPGPHDARNIFRQFYEML